MSEITTTIPTPSRVERNKQMQRKGRLKKKQQRQLEKELRSLSKEMETTVERTAPEEPTGKNVVRIPFAPYQEHAFSYIVQPGDHVRKVARNFGTEASLIREDNELKTDRLIPGEVLQVKVPLSHVHAAIGKVQHVSEEQINLLARHTYEAVFRVKDNVVEYGDEGPNVPDFVIKGEEGAVSFVMRNCDQKETVALEEIPFKEETAKVLCIDGQEVTVEVESERILQLSLLQPFPEPVGTEIRVTYAGVYNTALCSYDVVKQKQEDKKRDPFMTLCELDDPKLMF